MADTDRRRGTTFISHATEDKGFVKVLADMLISFGVSVWYDDYQIGLGDSIRAKLGEGLLDSEYGIVVLSPNFFAKKWPKQELAALANILDSGRLVPVFHNISVEEVGAKDPLLLDIKGISSERGDHYIASLIAKKVLGTDEKDPSGRTVYRHETVRVADLPLSEDACLEEMAFEDCVLIGPAVFTPHENVRMSETVFNSLAVFLPVLDDIVHVGTIGLRDASFTRCRFKNVGFIVNPEELESIRKNMSVVYGTFPEHLQ
jgi:hypothetical protein